MSEKMQIHGIFSFKNAREQHLCIIGVNGKAKKEKSDEIKVDKINASRKLRARKITRVENYREIKLTRAKQKSR